LLRFVSNVIANSLFHWLSNDENVLRPRIVLRRLIHIGFFSRRDCLWHFQGFHPIIKKRLWMNDRIVEVEKVPITALTLFLGK
jgi:hypothetical protein